MTDAELQDLERRLNESSFKDGHGEWWHVEEHEGAAIDVRVSEVRALIAEVRRLRGLWREAEADRSAADRDLERVIAAQRLL
jgi:hypothetical protein